MSMELVTVGTGTVAPSARRTAACHWVSRGDLRVLLDCGAGSLHRLAEFGLPAPPSMVPASAASSAVKFSDPIATFRSSFAYQCADMSPCGEWEFDPFSR